MVFLHHLVDARQVLAMVKRMDAIIFQPLLYVIMDRKPSTFPSNLPLLTSISIWKSYSTHKASHPWISRSVMTHSSTRSLSNLATLKPCKSQPVSLYYSHPKITATQEEVQPKCTHRTKYQSQLSSTNYPISTLVPCSTWNIYKPHWAHHSSITLHFRNHTNWSWKYRDQIARSWALYHGALYSCCVYK